MEGIRRMPDNWKLKNHLAFMFMHKCADFPVQTKRDFGDDNFSLARKYYRAALARNPDAPLYVDRMVIHTYERQGDFETARELYRQHLERFPHDQTARKNLETFILEKEQYDRFLKKARSLYSEGKYGEVVEIYQDNLKNSPYLMPADIIEAVLSSYMKTDDFDNGMTFIHRKMNLKMEDSRAAYRLYEEFTGRYNAHYGTGFREMQRNREYSRIFEQYREKFKKKDVEISLENGIMVLESMQKTGRIDDARELLIDLERQNPGDHRLVPFRGALQDNN
jgi:tetratricopeptide (TPR) repeat protein